MNPSYEAGPGCEILSSRVLAYSKKQVFRAWTDPGLLQRWWGPAGFTNTFHEHDLRVGGRWRFTMHGPGKGHYENEVEFLEIREASLIAWERITKPLFRVVATFDDAGAGRTELKFRMQFDSKEACDKVRAFVPDKNEENFDRLERVLREHDAG